MDSFITYDNGIILNNNGNIVKINNNSIKVDTNNLNIGNIDEIDNKLNIDGNINLTGDIKHNNKVFLNNNENLLNISKNNINIDGNVSIFNEDLNKGGLSIGSNDEVGNGNLKINNNIINKFDKKVIDLSTEEKVVINPSVDSPSSTIVNSNLSIINNNNSGGLSIGISEYNAGDGNLVVTNNSNILKKVNIGSFETGKESLNILGFEGVNKNKIDNHLIFLWENTVFLVKLLQIIINK